MTVPYWKRCLWCINAPMHDSCKCTEPCGANVCPMLEDGKFYPDLQPVPKFQKETA